MSERRELIAKVKELNLKTSRPPHMVKTEELKEVLSNVKPPQEKKTSKRGRPVNPKSERQKYLDYIERRRKEGLLHKGKTGRKVDPTSERQQYLAKKEAGLIKRGRPPKVKEKVEE